MDCAVERASVGKGLMRQMVRLEIVPDHLDVVEFRRIIGKPLDGEPVGAGGQRCAREFAGVDWAVVLDEYHRFGGLAGSGTIQPIELLEMSDKVTAALGRAKQRFVGSPTEAACALRSVHRWRNGLRGRARQCRQ